MIRNHDFVSKKVAIVGRSGRGKSYFQRKLILAWPADYIFGFDQKDEFKTQGGFFQCRNDSECDAALQQTGLVNYRPTYKSPAELRAEFSKWIKKTFEVCQKLPSTSRKLIYFDEVKRLIGTNPKLFENHEICPVLETGREFGIDLLCAAQRPSHMVPDFRGQMSQWVCFQMPGGWLKPLYEDFEEEQFSHVTALEKGEYIAYDADTGEFEKGGEKVK
jgi:hypothetical protein